MSFDTFSTMHERGKGSSRLTCMFVYNLLLSPMSVPSCVAFSLGYSRSKTFRIRWSACGRLLWCRAWYWIRCRYAVPDPIRNPNEREKKRAVLFSTVRGKMCHRRMSLAKTIPLSYCDIPSQSCPHTSWSSSLPSLRSCAWIGLFMENRSITALPAESLNRGFNRKRGEERQCAEGLVVITLPCSGIRYPQICPQI